MKVVITGATGLIGGALAAGLMGDGHQVVALVRNPSRARGLDGAQLLPWDAAAGPPPPEAFQQASAVVHLAGEPVAAGRWTVARKESIRRSRVEGTRHLVEALSALSRPPSTLLSGSAVGYYGTRGDEELDEESESSDDFLGRTCREWEAEAVAAEQQGIRVALLRTGIVLSTRGGALPRMLPPFRMFIGGPLGSGQQWMSWIHLDDELGAIRHVLENESVTGALNLTAPQPVTNETFTRELAQALGRPAFFRVPGLVMKLALGEMAESLLLNGQRVFPRKLERNGYRFRFPELRTALRDLLK